MSSTDLQNVMTAIRALDNLSEDDKIKLIRAVLAQRNAPSPSGADIAPAPAASVRVCGFSVPIDTDWLDLSNSGIQVFTKADVAAIAQLKSLRRVYLSGNQLTHLPSNLFAHNAALETVYLCDNLLTKVPSVLFAHNPLLTHVNFRGNKLTTLPPDLFAHTPALEFVDFGLNELTAVPATLFHNTPALTCVKFKNNQLTCWPAGLYARTPTLSDVDFRDNKLCTLPSDVHLACYQLWLWKVRLSGNPIHSVPISWYARRYSWSSGVPMELVSPDLVAFVDAHPEILRLPLVVHVAGTDKTGHDE